MTDAADTRDSPSIEQAIAGLARANSALLSGESVRPEDLAPALEWFADTQLRLADVKSSDTMRMVDAVLKLELKLTACDSELRARYIMETLELPKSSYYRIRGVLAKAGLIESQKMRLPDEAEALAG